MTDQQPPYGPPPSYTPPPSPPTYPPTAGYPQGPPTGPGMPAAPPPGPGGPSGPSASSKGVPAWWLPVVACICLAVGAVLGGVVAGSGDDDGDDVATSTTEDEPATTDEEPSSTTEPEDDEPTTTEEETEEEPTTTAEEAEDANPTFGETFTYDDGLAFSVAAPTPFTPSETASGGEGSAAFLQFEVTVTNGSDTPYEPPMSSFSIQSGTAEGEQVFDTAQGFNGAPSTPVLAGREVTFKIGFGVADPADLVLQVSPDFEREPIFFVS